jgi:hypothetical protein
VVVVVVTGGSAAQPTSPSNASTQKDVFIHSSSSLSSFCPSDSALFPESKTWRGITISPEVGAILDTV